MQTAARQVIRISRSLKNQPNFICLDGRRVAKEAEIGQRGAGAGFAFGRRRLETPEFQEEVIMAAPKPVVLCILDGWGLSEDRSANAPALADTPVMDRLVATCPNATLITHGPDVGLPEEIRRSDTRISARAGLWRWIWARSTWRSRMEVFANGKVSDPSSAG